MTWRKCYSVLLLINHPGYSLEYTSPCLITIARCTVYEAATVKVRSQEIFASHIDDTAQIFYSFSCKFTYKLIGGQ